MKNAHYTASKISKMQSPFLHSLQMSLFSYIQKNDQTEYNLFTGSLMDKIIIRLVLWVDI
jgi:hypothetical protein